jgi:hypothetical protein
MNTLFTVYVRANRSCMGSISQYSVNFNLNKLALDFLILFNALCVSIILYGCKTWVLTPDLKTSTYLRGPLFASSNLSDLSELFKQAKYSKQITEHANYNLSDTGCAWTKASTRIHSLGLEKN